VVLIVVLFVLPPAWPVTATSFNYAPVAVLVVLALSGAWWLVSARRWFTGPPEVRSATERPPVPDELI
jgi:hypothetical protein